MKVTKDGVIELNGKEITYRTKANGKDLEIKLSNPRDKQITFAIFEHGEGYSVNKLAMYDMPVEYLATAINLLG